MKCECVCVYPINKAAFDACACVSCRGPWGYEKTSIEGVCLSRTENANGLNNRTPDPQ